MCRDCNQNFPGKVPLDRHKYEVHGKRIDTHCEQCDKFFMDTTNAKKHMKLMHPIQVCADLDLHFIENGCELKSFIVVVHKKCENG